MTIRIENAITPTVANLKYLKIDQTAPVQTVINGKPIFDVGIKANDSIILKNGKKLVLDGQ